MNHGNPLTPAAPGSLWHPASTSTGTAPQGEPATEEHIRGLELTNLDKVFWPEGLTKYDLIKYYIDMAPVLLPYLRDRPLVLKRYPDGITGAAFYQKECPVSAPEWVATLPVSHSDSAKTVNYVLGNNEATLAWLANLGCIEVHAWLSRAGHLEYPDIAVMDLDPAPGITFNIVLEIALLVNHALKEFHLTGYPKTSGASGLHIFIPIYPRWTFRQVTAAMRYLAQLIVAVCPKKATTARPLRERRGKVYLDYLQNARGRSMAFPYSLRPLPGAPVSAPLTWEEVAGRGIDPAGFNLHTIRERLAKYGDLYRELLEHPNDLQPLLELAGG